jgi:ATP/maltotriose-dependent transcriptional regulator MalT
VGQPAAALAAFEQARGSTEPQFARDKMQGGPDGVGWIRREAGDYAGALAYHRGALARAPAQETRFFELFFTIELSADLLALGDVPGAAAALERARALFSAGPAAVYPGHARRAQLRLLTARARCALAAGDSVAAEEAARSLLELAALDPSHEHQIQAQELLARVALGQHDAARAQAAVTAALLLLEQYPSVLLAWPVHALAARIALLRGERALASSQAGLARELVLQLGGDLRAVELEQTFLGSPPVQAVLVLASGSPGSSAQP